MIISIHNVRHGFVENLRRFLCWLVGMQTKIAEKISSPTLAWAVTSSHLSGKRGSLNRMVKLDRIFWWRNTCSTENLLTLNATCYLSEEIAYYSVDVTSNVIDINKKWERPQTISWGRRIMWFKLIMIFEGLFKWWRERGLYMLILLNYRQKMGDKEMWTHQD